MRRYPEVEYWLAGAIGEPGQRTFLIQFSASDGIHSYVIEKTQVAALIVEGRRLLEAIGQGRSAGSRHAVQEYVMPEFRIAEIHLAYDEAEGRIGITLIPTTDEVESVEFSVALEQFAAALDPARRAVEGGRPSCPRCGLAMDPSGHHCPATNGDLRGHRP